MNTLRALSYEEMLGYRSLTGMRLLLKPPAPIRTSQTLSGSASLSARVSSCYMILGKSFLFFILYDFVFHGQKCYPMEFNIFLKA